MKDRIQLSDHFTTGRLLKFTYPSIAMTIFLSIYTIIDGIFVSNFAGKDAFTAVNLIWPFAQLIAAFGFMLGSGGSALIAQMLGRKEQKRAEECFSLIIAVAFLFALICGMAEISLLPNLARQVKAEGAVYQNCLVYGRVLFICVPFYTLQYVFQSFMIVAEKPKLGLAVTILAGVLNFVGDYFFIKVMGFGIFGAGIATGCSQFIGAMLPMLYFLAPNDSLLHFRKFRYDGKFIRDTCVNGISELFSNISLSLVTIVYNFQLMKYIGENGVDAYGVIAYVSYVFVASFLGYSSGSVPIVSYHYGAKNQKEIQNILKKSLGIVAVGAGLMFLLSNLLSKPFATIFTGYDAELLMLSTHALKIYSFYYLFSGFSIYMSGFFTALGNGPISAVISFTRTVLFEITLVLLLPAVFRDDGIWLSPVIAQVLALFVSFGLLLIKNKQYGYLNFRGEQK